MKCRICDSPTENGKCAYCDRDKSSILKRGLFVLIILFLFIGTARADFKIEFKNPTEKRLYYRLDWGDHPQWKEYPPYSIMGGEVPSGESREISLGSREGRFRLTYNKKEYYFKVGDNEINKKISKTRYFFRADKDIIAHPDRLEEVK